MTGDAPRSGAVRADKPVGWFDEHGASSLVAGTITNGVLILSCEAVVDMYAICAKLKTQVARGKTKGGSSSFRPSRVSDSIHGQKIGLSVVLRIASSSSCLLATSWSVFLSIDGSSETEWRMTSNAWREQATCSSSSFRNRHQTLERRCDLKFQITVPGNCRFMETRSVGVQVAAFGVFADFLGRLWCTASLNSGESTHFNAFEGNS